MPSHKSIIYSTPSQPRQVRLDTITACNATCLSCHRHLTKRKGAMPMEMLERLLNDISHWTKPLEEIVPVNYGEFFLLKNWYEVLHLIAQKLPFTQISFATNGSLMADDTTLKVSTIPTIRDINFSINAYYDETYEKFMGLKANVIPIIRKAVAQFKILRPDIRLKVSMVFDPKYQTDLERDYFQWYWKGWAEPWVIAAASAGRPDKKPECPVEIPCRSIFDAIVIGYDGKISSCCFDPDFAIDLGYYSGNLLADWHSEKFIEFRAMHNERRRDGLCYHCTFA